MTVTNYTTTIKEICDVLGSINVTVDKDEMVQIGLGGLHKRYGPIGIAICTKGETTVIFPRTIDAYGRRKPWRCVKEHALEN